MVRFFKLQCGPLLTACYKITTRNEHSRPAHLQRVALGVDERNPVTRTLPEDPPDEGDNVAPMVFSTQRKGPGRSGSETVAFGRVGSSLGSSFASHSGDGGTEQRSLM